MNWKLTIGGSDVSSFLRDGASFTEIASSSDGAALFTVNGNHDVIVTGASVVLSDVNDAIAWEGVVASSSGQNNRAGEQIATLVRAAALSSAFAIGIAGGSSQNSDIAALAAQIADNTHIPWGGPVSIGVQVGSLSFSRADEALTVLSTLADSTWRVQNGQLVFVSSRQGIAEIPVTFNTTPNTNTLIDVLGGVDAATRVPLSNQVVPVGSPGGNQAYVSAPELADATTLAIFADVLGARYGSGSINAQASFTGVTLRAGDWAIDANGVATIAYRTTYEIVAGDLRLSAQFGFPPLPLNQQYSAAFADAMHRAPIVRLTQDYLVSGADVSIIGLTATLTQAVIALSNFQYTVAQEGVSLPQNGIVYILVSPDGFSVTTELEAPAPGTALVLYRIVTSNGIVYQQLDLRSHGGINAIHLQPADLPTPTFSGQSAAATDSVAGLTSDVTVGATFTNIPTDGTVARVAWFIRTHGASEWNPWAETALPGLPAPAASQALSIVYAAIPNSGEYDFGAAYVSLRGDVGPTGTIESAFALGPLAIPAGDGPPMPSGIKTSGPTVTASSLGTPIGLGTAGFAQPFSVTIDDWLAGHNPTWFEELFFFKRQHGDTNAIPVGSISANTSGLVYSSVADLPASSSGWDIGVAYFDAAGQTSAIVWPVALNAALSQLAPGTLQTGSYAAPTVSPSATESIEGTSSAACDVVVNAHFNNVPASPANGIRWFVRSNGTTTWSAWGETSLSATSFKYAGLVNGGTYDFAAAYIGLRKDDVGSIVVLLTAVAVSAITGLGIPNFSASLPAPAVSSSTLSNGATPTSLAADVLAAVSVTNAPTNGSASGLTYYFRVHGQTTWIPYDEQNLVGLPTPAASQTLPSFAYGQLQNGTLYDFAVGYVGAAGYGAVTQIGSPTQITDGYQAASIVVTTPYLIGTTSPTPTVTTVTVTNGLSANGVAAAVRLQFTLTNQPTDGSLSRISVWFRVNGASAWTFYTNLGVPGLPTPSASQSYDITLADLTNGQSYDFAVSFENAQGQDSATYGTISTNWAAVALSLPPTSLPTGASGFTPPAITSGPSSVTYAAANSGAYGVSFICGLAAGMTTGTNSWIAGYQAMLSFDGGTTWNPAGPGPALAAPGTYQFNYGGIGAGQVAHCGVRLVDYQGKYSNVLEMFTTVAQTMSGSGLASMPATGTPSQATAPTMTGAAIGSVADTLAALSKLPISGTFADWAANAQPGWFAGGNLYRRTHGASNVVQVGSFVVPGDGVTFAAKVSLPAGESDDIGFSFVDQSSLHETPIQWPGAWSNITLQQLGGGGLKGGDPVDTDPILENDPSQGLHVSVIKHEKASIATRSRILDDNTLLVDDTTGPVSGELPFPNHNPVVQGLPGGKNLVVNGSNSAGTGALVPSAYGWTGVFNSPTSLVSSVGPTMLLTSPSNDCGYYQEVPCSPGETYTFVAAVNNNTSGASPRLWIGATDGSLQYNSAPGVPVGSVGAFYNSISTTFRPGSSATSGFGLWEVLYGTFVVPSGVRTMRIMLFNQGASRSAYYSGVMVYQGSKLQDYIDHELGTGAVGSPHVADGAINDIHIGTLGLPTLGSRTADHITYVSGGATVDSLKPEEAGAEVTTGKPVSLLKDSGGTNIAGTRFSGGKPLIDFAESIHLNQNIDNIPDTASRSAIATSETDGSAGSRTIAQLKKAGLTRDVTMVASRIGSDGALVEAVSAGAQNLVRNPSFESATQLGGMSSAAADAIANPYPSTTRPAGFADYWATKYLGGDMVDADYTVSTSNAVEGRHTLKIGPGSGTYLGSAASYPFPVVGGAPCYVEATAMGDSAPAHARLLLTISWYTAGNDFNRADGQFISDSTLANLAPPAVMTTYSNTLTAPANAAYAIVSISHWNDGVNPTSSWSLYADNVKVYRTNMPHSTMSLQSQDIISDNAGRGQTDFSNPKIINRTADHVTYVTGGATVDSLKPEEAGANVTETRTANDVQTGAGKAVLEIGANKTETRTSADTAAVNGTAAATISQGAGRANAAIDSGDVVVAAAIDLSRGYTNKNLNAIAGSDWDNLNNFSTSRAFKIALPNIDATIGVLKLSVRSGGSSGARTQTYYIDKGDQNAGDITLYPSDQSGGVNYGHLGNYTSQTGGVLAFSGMADVDTVYYLVYLKKDGGGAGSQLAIYVTAQLNTVFTPAQVSAAYASGGSVASFASVATSTAFGTTASGNLGGNIGGRGD